MKRILIVKVTSLGDVIETLPVVSDLRRSFQGVRIDWAVDASCADIVRWNAGVDRVLCAPLRRFKRARGLGDLRVIGGAIRELRSERYDAVIDIHGVYKSAIISRLARSRRRVGYRSTDLGERGAAFAYNERFGPRPDGNAWHGLRVSVGDALGYAVDTPPDFNLSVPRDGKAALPEPDGPVALLFHGTSKEEKCWPLAHWATLGRELASRGLRIEIPWGSDAERARAVEIASVVPRASVLPKLSIAQLAQRIDDAALVVGTDTGFVHLSHALMKPTVMVFVSTSPSHSGVHVAGRSVSVGDGVGVPPVAQVLDAVNRVYRPFHAGAAAPDREPVTLFDRAG